MAKPYKIRIKLDMTKVQKNNVYMKELIEAFPEDLNEALIIAKNNTLKKKYPKFTNVVICGMGGSGIGGKLVASWIMDEINIPVNFCQDYSLPNYVNETTLIIASSNSGNTEEVISASKDGYSRGACIVGICSGGKLEAFCNLHEFESIIVPNGKPPRTTLAFSIVQLVHVFSELNLINKNRIKEFNLAHDLLKSEKEEIQGEAKKLASFVNGKELIIYSESKDEAVAIRARQQFNENSKILCNHHTVPEMNHNELVAWEGGSNRYAVVFLNTNDWNVQNVKRQSFSIQVIEKKTEHILFLSAKGDSILVRSLYLIHLIDWASLYLAEINSVDAVCINIIDELKNYLKN